MLDDLTRIQSFLLAHKPALARLLTEEFARLDELTFLVSRPPEEITWYRRRKLEELDLIDTAAIVEIVLAATTQVDLTSIVPSLKKLAALGDELRKARDSALAARRAIGVEKHNAYVEALRAAAQGRKAPEKPAKPPRPTAAERKRLRLQHEEEADQLAREIWAQIPGYPQTFPGTPAPRSKPWWAYFRLLEGLDPQGYTLERLPRDVLMDLTLERITPEAALAAVKERLHAPSPPLAAS